MAQRRNLTQEYNKHKDEILRELSDRFSQVDDTNHSLEQLTDEVVPIITMTTEEVETHIEEKRVQTLFEEEMQMQRYWSLKQLNEDENVALNSRCLTKVFEQSNTSQIRVPATIKHTAL